MRLLPFLLSFGLLASVCTRAAEPVSYSGIYPHLAMFNREGECGTGAVVPWADRLWVITYAPHQPEGSTDRLYEITPGLEQIIRPESVGGTPAGRLLHRESDQLFIGPYAIDGQRQVRVIPPQRMYGRLTAIARHLLDPVNKIYYATMEEGIYEVDVHSLEVKELWADQQRKEGRHSGLPGYHGKGLYSGQGQLVYANNGDHAKAALTDPATPSGILAEWDGQADRWTVIRRNQFTEVTGPGGLTGNAHPETDPLWSIGWDHRSLILMLRDKGAWHPFRLPKASHSYDGAHGWNTEWPRIREIGERDLLMTMHGCFWRFPAGFCLTNTAGLAPRSTFLKVTGDFSRWGDRVVFGCDDTAKNEFLNKRGAKGALAAPGQSQSNLWFMDPEQLDHLGPVLGSGAVWLRDKVKAGETSDPFLFNGYKERGLHLATGTADPVTVTIEVDPGTGNWRKLRDVRVAGYRWVDFSPREAGAWIRLRTGADADGMTAVFHYANPDPRPAEAAPLFSSLAAAEARDYSGGSLLATGDDRRTLRFAATEVRDARKVGEGLYELGFEGTLHLRRIEDAPALAELKRQTAVPVGAIHSELASVVVVDDLGRRWRLPKTEAAYELSPAIPLRVCREVSTERDLFQAHGIFYELPAENAGGFPKMRPIATHRRTITDFTSYRGLLVLSGLAAEAPEGPHVIRSDDGRCALWVGGFDDLWQLGKPAGHGGPWYETAVTAGEVSDPYLFHGFDRKKLVLSQHSSHAATFVVEVDLTGEGDWQPYRTFYCQPRESTTHDFPEAFAAYWVRLRCDSACEATATFIYQ